MKKEYKLGNRKLEIEIRRSTKKEFLQSILGTCIIGVSIYYFFFNK